MASAETALGLDTYFVKEHVGFLKLTDTYDILDPAADGRLVAQAKEEPESWAKWLRLVMDKRFLPTRVNVYDGEKQEGARPLFSIEKPFTFFRAKVTVRDEHGQELGYFMSKLFSLGGGFWVYRPDESPLAEVKGDWKGWNFTFRDPQGTALGQVTKKWAGLGKELFTSADNYVVALEPGKGELRIMLLAAALAIDVVFKEGKN